MNHAVKLYALIPLLTLLQGLIFCILLLVRRHQEERYSDAWLSMALLLLSLTGVPYMLGWMGINDLWEKFTYLPWDGFWYAIPPTLYFFLKSLTNDQWRFVWKRDYWNYIPYFFYFTEHLIVGLIGLNNRPFVEKWWNGNPFLPIFYEVLAWAVAGFYMVKSYRLYTSYRTWTLNEFSDVERVSFKWLRNFLILYFTLYSISIINELYIKISGNNNSSMKYQLMWVGYLTDTILMYYLSIAGYAQTRVKSIAFLENAKEMPLNALQNEENTEGVDEIETKEDEQATIIENEKLSEPIKSKNTLSESDLTLWKNKVLTYFEKENPYLNPELTLSELAHNLKTNTSILSQVINAGFDKNFNDFVNEYRVKAFQEKVKSKEYRHLTMLAVAFDCGFNSKATFNRAYKKLTGANPSAL
jgi:AraC-like DNA-binding protein